LKKALGFFILSIVITVCFQNCGDVNLAKAPLQIASVTSAIHGEFCAGTPGDPAMTLQNFTFINLTAKPVGSELLADSDLDGLDDSVEQDNSQFGFSLDHSRSTGILDGICYSQGAQDCVPSTCDQAPLTLGLTKCDSTAYSSSTLLTGVDTNNDGIPDFIEILRGMDPIRSNTDTKKMDRLQRGLDPVSNQDIPAPQQINTVYRIQSANSTCGNQDRYVFDVTTFPIVDVEASQTNTIFPEFNHTQNENVFLAYYVSYPVNRTLKAKIFYQILKVKKDSGPSTAVLNAVNFKLLGTFDVP
jgi:hypothetical protein